MTVISNDEEEAAKPMLKGGTMKFTPQTALQRAGGVYSRRQLAIESGARP
jgi:hypothetical protein